MNPKSAMTRFGSRRPIRTTVALALAFALFALPTLAASAQSGSDSTGLQPTGYIGQVSVPGFDSSLGELVSAELALSARSQSQVLQLTNLSGSAASLSATTSVQLCAALSAGLSSYWECAAPGPATVTFESWVDHGTFGELKHGRSTGGSANSAHEATTVTVLDPFALASFTDVDSIDFGIATLSESHTSGGYANVTAQTSTDVTLRVSYDYAAVEIETLTNGEDGIELDAGESVDYTYNVTNTGTTTLRDVSVVDDTLGQVCTVRTLFAGQAESCSVSGVASADQRNVGTVTATSGVNTAVAVSASDSTSHTVVGAAVVETPAQTPTQSAPESAAVAAVVVQEQQAVTQDPAVDVAEDQSLAAGLPGIDIEVATNGIDADAGSGPEYNPGASIIWNYVVTNTGSVDLVDLIITDDLQGGVCTASALDVNESVSCSLEGLAGTGEHVRIGTVVAQSLDGINVTDQDATRHTGVDIAAASTSAGESAIETSSVATQAVGTDEADDTDEADVDIVEDVAISAPAAADEVLGEELAFTGAGDGAAAVALVLSGIGLISLCAGEAVRRRNNN